MQAAWLFNSLHFMHKHFIQYELYKIVEIFYRIMKNIYNMISE